MTANEIIRALEGIRICAQPEEYAIHAEIDRALTEVGIPHIHEYRIASGRRIDFICGRIGIEVKKGRPQSALLRRQAEKYLSSEQLDALIIVLQKPCYLPDTICRKPVYVVCLNRLWGVALP